MVAPELSQQGCQGRADRAQADIKTEGGGSTKAVIADLVVSRCRSRFVELDPCFTGTDSQRLDLTSRGQQNPGQIVTEVLEQGAAIAVAGQQRKREVEVAGDALSKPKSLTDDGSAVVIGAVVSGSQPPHIPLVEVFVTDQLKQLPVAIG